MAGALSTHYHYAMTTADHEAKVILEVLNGAYLTIDFFAFFYRHK